MGLLDAFRGKSPQDKFAHMLQERLKKGGETREVSYDAEAFTLCRTEDDQTFYLGNAFAEFERADDEDRESVIRVFLSTWFTSQFELPESFDDAKTDILLTVRDRSYFEVDIPLCSDTLELGDGLLYSEFAECLAIAPVYDMPTSIRSLSDDDLTAWDVTLYEVIEIAKQNLREITQQCAQAGDVFLFASGDSHDAARMLLTDVIESLETAGSPIAMVPNREMLIVTGEQSTEGLEAMLGIAGQALDHERRISSSAFRLTGGNWSPWLPDEDHPLHQAFKVLRVQGQLGDYERQQELWQKRLATADGYTFVSRFAAIEDDDDTIRTYTIWPATVPASLPHADYVMFMASNDDGSPSHLAAAAEWQTVERLAGDLMSAEECYPPRFRVSGFPDGKLIAQLGMVDWANRSR